jgi:uncharacterized glyoxalase superfamily protein PhnB
MMAVRRRNAAMKKAKTAKRPTRKTAPVARGAKQQQRKTEPETLRLRSIEPALTVADLQRSIKFYGEALGFFISDRYTDKGGTLQGVMLKAGVCEIGLSQDDWAKGRDRQRGGAMRIYCTTVQNLDKLAARVKAAGYQLTEEVHDQPWGGRAFSVDDPDGFHLTIYRPTEK